MAVEIAAESNPKDVEFKTIDGLTLRGSLFLGPKDGPAIIVNGAVRPPLKHNDSFQMHKTNERSVCTCTTNVFVSLIARKRSSHLKLRSGLGNMA